MTASCPAPIGLGIGGAPCYPYIRFLDFLGNKSTSTYHSLQMTLTHRYSNGLYLLGGYTWAHAIDTTGRTNNLGYVPQNSLDPNAEKASGDYDIRHRFTLSATYDLPSRKSWGQMLEGWQVTSIVQWQTGYPILLYDNSKPKGRWFKSTPRNHEHWVQRTAEAQWRSPSSISHASEMSCPSKRVGLIEGKSGWTSACTSI